MSPPYRPGLARPGASSRAMHNTKVKYCLTFVAASSFDFKKLIVTYRVASSTNETQYLYPRTEVTWAGPQTSVCVSSPGSQ
jgi:hypothetical protein